MHECYTGVRVVLSISRLRILPSVQTFLRRRPLAVGVLACGLLGSPGPVKAQETAFLAAVRELAANPGLAAAARLQMKAALSEWDRQIQAFDTPQPAASGAFDARLARGLAFRRRGRIDDALREFDAAAAGRPVPSDVHMLRGLTLQTAGRHQEAGLAFQEAWRRDPDNPVKAYLARAINALRPAFQRILSGRHGPAATPFLTLDLIPDTLSRTPIVGSGAVAPVFAHLAAGRLDEAVAALDASPAAPSEGSAMDRGRAAEAEGRLGDAAREYATALTGALAGRHALYVGIGRLAQVQGNPDAAVDAFAHAARLSPNDPAIRRELGAAYVAAGRPDDAFAEFVAALLISPENVDVLAAVGQLYIDTDRPADAIPVLERVLAIRATRYETHYALAVALSRVGRTDDAAREFQRFERLSREALDARRKSVAGDAGPGQDPR